MRFITLLAALFVAAALPAPAARADSFAAAVGYNEDGTEAVYQWCRRSTLGTAKTCAINACSSDNSDNNGDCEFAVWCEPGAWSGVVAMKLADEIQHVAVCEKVSRKAALKAMKNQCRAFRKAHPSSFKFCNVESLVSPNAESSDRDVVTWEYRNGDIRAAE